MENANLFLKDCIKMELKATDKWEAIRELSGLLLAAGKINSLEEYIQAVAQRESEISTGVGFGIGIPHGKSPAVLESSVAFGRSNAGIEFDSIDQKPVTLVFLLAIPETVDNKDYLRTLADLARMLVHEEIRQQLLEAKTKEDLLLVLQNYKRPEAVG